MIFYTCYTVLCFKKIIVIYHELVDGLRGHAAWLDIINIIQGSLPYPIWLMNIMDLLQHL